VSGRLAWAGFWILGPPPAAGAPRHERLRWVRGCYLRTLPLSLIVYALVVIYLSAPWDWLAPVVGALLWLEGYGSLTIRIRRERQQG
jgi:hypothetical protein